MSLFRTVSLLVLGASVVVAVMMLLASLLGRRRRAAAPKIGGLTLRRLSLWDRLVHAAASLSFLTLAVTGFLPPLAWDAPLGGYLLMVHVSAGPVFAMSLLAMTLTWQRQCRFDLRDADWLMGLASYLGGGDPRPAGQFDAGQKILFWLVAAAGLSTVATMTLAMAGIWGPEGIEVLREIHRYSALAMTAGIVLHVYFTLCRKRGVLTALATGNVPAEWAWRHHRLWYESFNSDEK